MPSVSIVIPSWDAAKLLEKTLPSALRQSFADFEVVVVDNGSPTRDTENLVEKLASLHPGKLRLVSLAEQAGYTGAVNAGVRSCTSRWIAVLGNDNIVPSDWLESLFNAINKNSWGAAMSQTIVAGELPPGPCTLNHFGRNIFYSDEHWRERAFPTFYPGGNAFIFDREIFSEPFADFYFAYQEDVSFGWRVRLRGLEVWQTAGPMVASFDGGSLKRKSVRRRSLVLTERNRCLNLLTFPEWHTCLRLAPLWLADGLASFLLGKNPGAKLEAWIWILARPLLVFRLRRSRQAERRVKDGQVCSALTYLYFSTVPEKNGWAQNAKRFANRCLFLYMKALFIPGQWHD